MSNSKTQGDKYDAALVGILVFMACAIGILIVADFSESGTSILRSIRVLTITAVIFGVLLTVGIMQETVSKSELGARQWFGNAARTSFSAIGRVFLLVLPSVLVWTFWQPIGFVTAIATGYLVYTGRQGTALASRTH